MKSTKEMIEVMQAYDRVEKIEYSHYPTRGWGHTPNPIWDWDNYDYRVMPSEPKQEPLLWEVGYYDGHNMFMVNRWFAMNELNNSYVKTGRYYDPNTKKFGYEEE